MCLARSPRGGLLYDRARIQNGRCVPTAGTTDLGKRSSELGADGQQEQCGDGLHGSFSESEGCKLATRVTYLVGLTKLPYQFLTK